MYVVAGLSWPSQSAMSVISTPDCRRCMGQHQAFGWFVPSIASELEEQPKAVAIGCHSLRARIALANQAVQEELFDEFGKPTFWGVEGFHWRSPREKWGNGWD